MVGQVVDSLASTSLGYGPASPSAFVPQVFFFIMIFMILIYFGCAVSLLRQLLSSHAEK